MTSSLSTVSLAALVDELEKLSFGIDPTTAGTAGGIMSGYSSGRSAAGTVSNALSAHGSKTKNEETARNVGRLTGVLGAVGGMALGYKHKDKLLQLARKHISKAPEMEDVYHGLVPFLGGTAGGIAAGAGTGALTSLRGRFRKEKKSEVQPSPEPQKPGKFEKWVKNTALIGAGYATGQGVGMLVERAAKEIAGPAWGRWQSPAKSNILRGAASIASIGAILALQEQEKEKARRMK